MVLNRKNLSFLLRITLVATLIGSLGWEIIERVFNLAGAPLNLTLAAPLAFDLHVVSLQFRPNLGSLIGFLSGVVLFFSVN